MGGNGSKPPTRKQCIAEGLKTCKFVVNDNPRVKGDEPMLEISRFSSVKQHQAIIDQVARDTGVDARLIRSIMYMETTHGYYDAPLAVLDWNKSILPMNINVAYWGSVFGDREALKKPANNIKAGARMIARIQANTHGAVAFSTKLLKDFDGIWNATFQGVDGIH